MATLDQVIDKKIGEVRFDAIDMSFGELISLFSSKELIIEPDFQRYFRWSEEQQSRLIESILLGLPIPQIFAVENETGVLELVDGLQRTSSVIHFIEPSLIGADGHLKLSGCDLIPELNGNEFTEAL